MIPVVLIHWGLSMRYPLDLIIHQANRFGNEVTLIHDAADAEVNAADYSERAARFEPYYVHLSTNHVDFEKRCFLRWFVLLDWMEYHNVPVVMYTDSDVLLYCNVSKECVPYVDCGLTLALGTSPATSYFTYAGLLAYCDFVQRVYQDEGDELKEMKRIYQEMRRQGLPGGIVDMTLFKFFKSEVRHVKVGEMTDIINGATWDHNINAADGYKVDRDGRKVVTFLGDKPYCHEANGKSVRFNSLHFQGGGGKKLIRQYTR